jgi:hypothetical protein
MGCRAAKMVIEWREREHEEVDQELDDHLEVLEAL